MVLLKSNDGETVEVAENAALLSKLIKLALEESDPEQCIPLANLNKEVLSKIVKYLERRIEFDSKKPQEIVEKLPELQDDVAKAEEKLKAWKKDVEIWEEEYMTVSMDMLYDLYLAANYMDIEGLLDLCVERIAGLLRGKTVKEMREVLNIKNDFTPEEEEEIQAKHKWAFSEL